MLTTDRSELDDKKQRSNVGQGRVTGTWSIIIDPLIANSSVPI